MIRDWVKQVKPGCSIDSPQLLLTCWEDIFIRNGFRWSSKENLFQSQRIWSAGAPSTMSVRSSHWRKFLCISRTSRGSNTSTGGARSWGSSTCRTTSSPGSVRRASVWVEPFEERNDCILVLAWSIYWNITSYYESEVLRTAVVFMFGPLLLGLSLADISQMLDVLSHSLTKENIHTDAFVLKSHQLPLQELCDFVFLFV